MIDNNTINLGQLTLRDSAANIAQVNGKLTHDFFRDLRYDLTINSEKFLMLNTTAVDNPIFYGHLMLMRLQKPFENGLIHPLVLEHLPPGLNQRI